MVCCTVGNIENDMFFESKTSVFMYPRSFKKLKNSIVAIPELFIVSLYTCTNKSGLSRFKTESPPCKIKYSHPSASHLRKSTFVFAYKLSIVSSVISTFSKTFKSTGTFIKLVDFLLEKPIL